MKKLALNRAFLMFEKGPLVLLSTKNGDKCNIMPLSWLAVIDFTPRFVICTGPWNYSCEALIKSGECVLAVPGVDLLDRSIEAGNVSGRDCDKFKLCGFKKAKAKFVEAALVRDCICNVECKLIEHIEKYDLFILEGIAAWETDRREKRAIHAVGDGRFVADGELFDRRLLMQKIPEWLKR